MDKYKPKYIVIKDYIKNNIRSGNLKPGDKIPSENKLSSLFKVSRVTATMAIRELSAEGIVDRVQGKGTFVREINRDKELYHETAKSIKISSELLESRHHVLVDVSVISPSDKLIEILNLDITDKVYEITRHMTLLKNDEMPIAIDYSYIPVKYFSNQNEVCFEPLSSSYLHEFLKNETSHEIKYIHIHIDAKLPNKNEAATLNVASDYPLVIWDTNILNSDNKVLALTTTIADPKKYRAFINFEA